MAAIATSPSVVALVGRVSGYDRNTGAVFITVKDYRPALFYAHIRSFGPVRGGRMALEARLIGLRDEVDFTYDPSKLVRLKFNPEALKPVIREGE